MSNNPISGVTKEIQKKTPGADITKLANSVSTQITGFESSIANSISSTVSSAKSALTSSLSSISSSISSATSNLFSSSSKSEKKLTDNSNKGKLETDDKLKSISSDSSAAIAQPVSFVSKKVQETVGGVSADGMDAAKKSLPSNVSADNLKSISNAVGSKISSAKEYANAVSKVANDVSSKIREIPEKLNSIKQSITTPISSTINSFTSTIKKGLSGPGSVVGDTINNAKTYIGSTVSAVKEVSSAAVSILPSPLQKYVSGASDAYLAKLTNKVMGSKAASFTNILSKLSGISDTSSLTSFYGNLLSFGNNYANRTDENGNNVDNQYGSATSSDIDKLYSAANSICGGIGLSELVNFQQNKDLYDILLQYAANLGLTDLILQMQNCGKGKTAYFDDRSKNLLKSLSLDTAKNGNASTYLAIQNSVGASNMNNAKQESLALIANSTTSKSSAPSVVTYSNDDDTNEAIISTVLDRYGLTAKDLVTEKQLGVDVVDASKLVVMGATSKYFPDQVVDKNDRMLIEASTVVFA